MVSRSVIILALICVGGDINDGGDGSGGHIDDGNQSIK